MILNKECNASGVYFTDGSYISCNGLISDSMMCSRVNEQGSCKGDSGRPLLVSDDDGNVVQVGIVSWAVRCAFYEIPSLAAHISQAYGWIRGEVCTRSKYAANYPHIQVLTSRYLLGTYE